VRHFLPAREALLESTDVDFLTLADGKDSRCRPGRGQPWLTRN
jgi:hypothetical protein